MTTSEDNTARLWDSKTGAALKVLQGHKDSVNSAAFSPDGKRVVTASDDHAVSSVQLYVDGVAIGPASTKPAPGGPPELGPPGTSPE